MHNSTSTIGLKGLMGPAYISPMGYGFRKQFCLVHHDIFPKHVTL